MPTCSLTKQLFLLSEVPYRSPAREPFVVASLSHPEGKIRHFFFCPETCFTMQATGIPFEKCFVNFNLQLVMSLNHTAENTGFAFQSRYNFERSERENQTFKFQKKALA